MLARHCPRRKLAGACASTVLGLALIAHGDPEGKVNPPFYQAPESASSSQSPRQDGAAEDAGVTAENKALPGPAAGGYSWSDRPRPRRSRSSRLFRHEPGAPVVTFPGFRLRNDGTSIVWVSLTRKAPVEPSTGGRTVVYRLPGAYVEVRNNTHPLLTGHFPSPVLSVRLRPEPDGSSLLLELREPVQPTHRVIDSPGGGMVLEITVPRGRGTSPLVRSDAGHRLLIESGPPPDRTGGAATRRLRSE